MKVLKINSISGLHQEMFQPKTNFYMNKLGVNNNILDATSYFWAKMFSKQRISKLISLLELNASVDQYTNPQYRGILSNKDLFIKRVLEAPMKLCYEAKNPQEFFSNIEIVSILCKLYSDFEFYPFELNIQRGFILDEISSKEMFENCLNPRKNPYYHFVIEEIMPIIYKQDPDIIFLYGPLSYYFSTISLLAKKHNPNIHICLSRHSSEYYSLNKITHLLKHNKYLFNIIDSLILEHFNDVEKQLIHIIAENKELSTVPSIIFKEKNSIIETYYQKNCKTDDMNIYYRMTDSRDKQKKVFDIHFDPTIKCYWNKCTFCGINKKYRSDDNQYPENIFSKKISELESLTECCDFLWFVDEAIMPDKLKQIAQNFLKTNSKVSWQARCRAEHSLLEPGLPELLSEAGLKELRIGLESASYRILKLMNKFEDDFDLKLIENIVSVYNKNGISIHCPMIIGFPQETELDRKITYDFLANLCNKYPLFSFNLNILNLDVSSEIYLKWQNYNLDRLEYPCEPQYFLGNSIAWIDRQKHNKLVSEINNFTRKHLFPWIPAGSITSSTVLYRLCENSRNTLIWKSTMNWKEKRLFSADMTLSLSENVAFSQSQEQYFFYQWETHHYMTGNKYLYSIINEFTYPQKVLSVIKTLSNKLPDVYKTDELIALIKKLFDYKFLEGTYIYTDIKTVQDLIVAYDNIYHEKTYIYEIETDQLLLDWKKYLIPGNALELGVGPGKNISFLLEKGFQVTGVDLSQIAINELKNKYCSTNCSFFVDDIKNFDILPEHYTLIICTLVLSYLTKEQQYILADRIKAGLKPGGYVYIKDLSERDPLFLIPNEETTDHRSFFNCEKIKELFKGLDIVELTDSYKKDERRIGCGGAFGIINYLGQKPST